MLLLSAATFIHTREHTIVHRRQKATQISSAAHWRLDNLVEDLKTELFARMHQYIVVELEKREKALQNMVEDMLAQHKAEKLEVHCTALTKGNFCSKN